MDKETLKNLLRQILEEENGECPVKLRKVPSVRVSEEDRLQTGNPSDRVYTHDLFTTGESPRLGCGIMEMEKTTFPWTLHYDELDYVISGSLTVELGHHKITAAPGEVIFIPKGSSIRFSVPEKARFLYVTYPADWKSV